jgi:exopolyphosphatase/guanosine-5'-triphosphate,3'-diphosphate pyrophosphatase
LTDQQYAVLDLGSNSFRLLVARRQGDLVQIVERVKEKVQLVRGFRDGRLDSAAIARAEACLRRYAQRLAGVPRDHVAVVGTHALREGANRTLLIELVQSIFQVSLRILSGDEEAALIFRGVQQREPPAPSVGRLVIDIGGGSTELAWGRTSVPEGLSSCKQGCVSIADRCFRSDAAIGPSFDAARGYLAGALAEALPGFEPVGAGIEVIGTSGTIDSVQQVLAANGWSDREITADGLARLVDALFDGRWDAETGLLGLAPERVDTFPAGVALLDGLFRRLELRSMRYVGAALEDGVLHEMLGTTLAPRDVRAATLRGLQQRFGIDTRQASRVRTTALALFDQAHAWWPSAVRAFVDGVASTNPESADGHTADASGVRGFAEPSASAGHSPSAGHSASAGQEWRELLAVAAELHELGLAVAARAHHRHGAYLLKHADLRGFSTAERDHLALLVRGHRRGLPALSFSGGAARERRQLVRVVALLRIAAILERSHADGDSPRVQLVASAGPEGDRLAIRLPVGWAETHPLSMREFAWEPQQLAAVGIRLDVTSV